MTHIIFPFRRIGAQFVALALLGSQASAVFTYDSDANAANGITEGTGVWNTSAVNWYDSDTTTDVVWPNNATTIANFGGGTGAPGTVVVGAVTANGLTFNTPANTPYTLSGGTINLTGTTPTITVNSPHSNTANTLISSVVTAPSLLKAGIGTVVFNSGSSTANNLGAVTINAGMIDLFGITTTTDVVVDSAGRFDTHSGSTWTMNSLTYNATANSNLVSLGSNSVSNYTIGAGGLNISAGTITVQGGTNVASNAISNVTINGALNMSGGTLAITTTSSSPTATGRVILNGNINATGNATISSTGAGTEYLDLGNAVRTINVGVSADPTPVAYTLTLSAVTQNGGITKTGAGILALTGTGSNTYTGLTTLNGGTLRLGKSAGIDAVAGNITVTSGILDWAVSDQVNNSSTITLNGGSLKFNNSNETFASLVQTGGTVNDQGNSNNAFVNITGALTASGGNAINLNSGGQWSVGSASFTSTFGTNATAISTNGNSARYSLFTIGAGGLSLTGQRITLEKATITTNVGSELALNGDVTASGANVISFSPATTPIPRYGVSQVNLGSGTRTFTIASGGSLTSDSDFVSLNAAGTTTNPTRTAVVGGINKAGTGLMVLNGVNTYTGNTTVSAGTLRLGATGSLDTTPRVTVASGGTFDVSLVTGGFQLKTGQTLEGGGTITGAFTANNGSIISGGTVGGDTTQLLSFNSNLNLSAGSVLNLDLGAAGDNDRLSVAGILTQTNGAKIVVGLGDLSTVTLGQSFDLLNWTGGYVASTNLGSQYRTGAGDSAFDLDLPDITSSGYMWDIGQFGTSGVIQVVASVPEPSRMMLLALAIGCLAFRRRR